MKTPPMTPPTSPPKPAPAKPSASSAAASSSAAPADSLWQRHQKALFLIPGLCFMLAGGYFAWRESAATATDSPLIPTPVPMQTAYWTSDGKIIAVGRSATRLSDPGDTYFWSYDTRAQKVIATQTDSRYFYGIALAPRGDLLLLGERNNSALTTASLEVRAVNDNFKKVIDKVDPISHRAWFSDTQFLAKKDTFPIGTDTWLYDIRTLQRGQRIALPPIWPLPTGWNTLQFSPDRRFAAVQEFDRYSGARRTSTSPSPIYTDSQSSGGTIDGRLAILSWPERKVVAKLPGDLWLCSQWLSDKRHLIGLTTIKDGNRTLRADIARFNIQTQKSTWVALDFTNQDGPLRPNFEQAQFSPDGRYLAANKGSGDWVLWYTESGKIAGTLRKIDEKIMAETNGYQDTQPRFSPDSRRVLRLRPEGIEVWDIDKITEKPTMNTE
jgi:hypothetical protein